MRNGSGPLGHTSTPEGTRGPTRPEEEGVGGGAREPAATESPTPPPAAFETTPYCGLVTSFWTTAHWVPEHTLRSAHTRDGCPQPRDSPPLLGSSLYFLLPPF